MNMQMYGIMSLKTCRAHERLFFMLVMKKQYGHSNGFSFADSLGGGGTVIALSPPSSVGAYEVCEMPEFESVSSNWMFGSLNSVAMVSDNTAIPGRHAHQCTAY